MDGQFGAGKSKLVKKKFLDNMGQAVVINIDVLRRTHPFYDEIFEEYGQASYSVLQGYSSKLVDEILNLSKANSYSVIFEVAMNNDKGLIDYLNSFKDAGYSNEVNVLAASKAKSDMTLFNRYCRQMKSGKHPRFVDPKFASIEKVKDTTMKIYNDPELYDSMEVYLNLKKGVNSLVRIYSSELKGNVTPADAIDFGVSLSKDLHADFFKKKFKKNYLYLLENNEVEIYKKLKETANKYFENPAHYGDEDDFTR